jgi:hypothetical protein
LGPGEPPPSPQGPPALMSQSSRASARRAPPRPPQPGTLRSPLAGLTARARQELLKSSKLREQSLFKFFKPVPRDEAAAAASARQAEQRALRDEQRAKVDEPRLTSSGPLFDGV